MATIRAFAERVNKLDIKQVVVDVFMENSAHVIEKNLDQLQRGETPKGDNLKDYKAYTITAEDVSYPITTGDIGKQYAQFKNELNNRAGYGNPDFKLTGAFWSSFIVEQTQGTEYEISATDWKAPKLEARDGKENIYGLSGRSISEFIVERYQDALSKKVKDILQL